MGSAALPGRAGQGGPDRGDQPGVGVGSDQLDSGQAAGGQRPPDRQPAGAVLAGGHVDAQDFAVALGVIVARTFSTTADTALANNAVNMAVDNRTRSGPTILQADHGTQFTSWSFGENIRRWGLLGSFGTVGDCFDNAAMESFWARMQVELLNTRRWATTIELAAAMADYIDNFYNVERRQSYLGTSARQSSKRSGRSHIRSLNSRNDGSKRRGRIRWTHSRGTRHLLQTKCEMAEKTAGNHEVVDETNKSLAALEKSGRLGSFITC